MKHLARVLTILSMFVIFSGVLPVAEATHLSPHSGKWTAADVDGSTIQLYVVEGRHGFYHLKWHDDYWSIGDGAPGYGFGISAVDARNRNILHTKL